MEGGEGQKERKKERTKKKRIKQSSGRTLENKMHQFHGK